MLEADVEPAGQTVEADRQPEMESQDLNAEVIRLTLELHEATEEKLQAARYGLVVLDENEALKTKHRQLEEEYEALKAELQQLKEVRMLCILNISKHNDGASGHILVVDRLCTVTQVYIEALLLTVLVLLQKAYLQQKVMTRIVLLTECSGMLSHFIIECW